MICVGRDPNDPEYPRLKPIGVYSVRKGWARINLDDVAGIKDDYYSPLYITPGAAFSIALLAYKNIRGLAKDSCAHKRDSQVNGMSTKCHSRRRPTNEASGLGLAAQAS